MTSNRVRLGPPRSRVPWPDRAVGGELRAGRPPRPTVPPGWRSPLPLGPPVPMASRARARRPLRATPLPGGVISCGTVGWRDPGSISRAPATRPAFVTPGSTLGVRSTNSMTAAPSPDAVAAWSSGGGCPVVPVKRFTCSSSARVRFPAWHTSFRDRDCYAGECLTPHNPSALALPNCSPFGAIPSPFQTGKRQPPATARTADREVLVRLRRVLAGVRVGDWGPDKREVGSSNLPRPTWTCGI